MIGMLRYNLEVDGDIRYTLEDDGEETEEDCRYLIGRNSGLPIADMIQTIHEKQL